MHFSRYEEAPRSVAEEIVAKVQGRQGKIKFNRPARNLRGHNARRLGDSGPHSGGQRIQETELESNGEREI